MQDYEQKKKLANRRGTSLEIMREDFNSRQEKCLSPTTQKASSKDMANACKEKFGDELYLSKITSIICVPKGEQVWVYGTERGEQVWRLKTLGDQPLIAWAINQQSLAVLGSQALIAYRNSSGLPHVYTSSIDQPFPIIQQSSLSFEVPQLSATYTNNEMIIFATINLPPGLTTIYQVWQEAPMNQSSPGSHNLAGDNRWSLSTLDLLTGSCTLAGTLMPMGAIVTRYLKVFKVVDPAWFYLHVACQISAYAVGVAGWATVIKLGGKSAAIQYTTHHNIGIALFTLGTL
ncbi:cytochrome b561 and DOMON domain-containing protein [Cucumis melo var. makuwa]|uniref:Cytochrome b561 and DOMON domain-containing protein n=1 Tax=Cucumis melo var. makuwa TaxID=1194695 RepID=A0A5D3DDG5_CUCMM|nr:cytochrome b561 and DOMON domain-containing protein [Cucumis melo var. makuwa]TYK21490.1 cytochrome b561 and DOMON domain-containing protein [Cucumis melo var. makuwa]